MKSFFGSTIKILFCFLISLPAHSQLDNNQDEFSNITYREGNRYRAASGVPGPEYWQNGADYAIDVELDDKTNVLNGKVTITYYNNSPFALDFVWMHLEQNRFTKDSRGTLTTPITGSRYAGDVDGGYEITNLSATTGKSAASSKHIITDTRMQVFFNEPIAANGGKATISMDFSFKVPQKGMDRMGMLETKNGTIYAFAQWYPKMAVLDDVSGWDTEPYLGAGEFYLGYGNFDYKITVPYDHIVVGSGKLVNEKDVLTKVQQERMKNAAASDQTLYIITPDEVGNTALTRPKQSGKLTWHFKMENTRDVAWGSSKAFVWDGARMNLANGKKAMAQSAYPVESHGDNAWERSTQYIKASIEHYSKKWFNYPYPVAVNVAADIGGMEYPGLSFCRYTSKAASLWGVTDHEFGHMWFPMIVGTNERRYAWMDEGLNSFINLYSSIEFGEYPPRLTSSKSFIVNWLQNPNREAISTHPDITQPQNLGMAAYFKPAYGFYMLREYVLGHERFDNAFRKYIETWAYKHPRPEDLFNIMENVAGEDLSWFWKHWIYSNENIDLALEAVSEVNGDYLLTFVNKGGMPMPVHFEVTYADGSTEKKHLPVEVWHRGDRWIYLLETDKKPVKIQIDPKGILADIDESNNVWTE